MPAPGPIPYDAPVVERGVGLFETLLLIGRHAVLWDAHAARLLGTLAGLELPAPDEPTLLRAASEAVARAGEDDRERALRLSWIAVGADLEEPASWRLDATVRAIPSATLQRRAGSACVTVPPELRRDTPSVKSTSYFAAILAGRRARRRGGDEGLFTDARGRYLEGASTALAVWGDRSPRLADGAALPSVTAAAFFGPTPKRGPVGREDVLEGAFLLGSLTKAVPVLSLDGEPCAVPEPMREALDAFNARLLTESRLIPR